MTESWGPYEWALDYMNRGFWVEPYEKSTGKKGPRSKRIIIKDIFELGQYPFHADTCVGFSSDPGHVFADLDAPEAAVLAPYYLPATGMISGHPGRERTHWIYKLKEEDKESRPTKFMDPTPLSNDKPTIIEYMHNTGTTKAAPMLICPPTWYDEPRKGRATWDAYDDPSEVNALEIFHLFGVLASAVILSRCWIDGQRNELTLAISGALLREKWTPKEIADFIRPIAQYMHDEEWENRLLQPAVTASRGNSGQTTMGWPSVAKLIGSQRATKLQEWLSFKNATKQNKASGAGTGGGGQQPPTSIPPFDIATAVYDEHNDKFKYVSDMQEWASYKMGLWRVDHDAKLDVEAACIEMRQKLAAQTRGAQPMSWKNISDAVSILRTMEALRTKVDDFDDLPFMLNGPDGTHDLEKGFLAPYDALQRLTRQMPTPYDKDASCPFWEQQMALTWPDRETREYIQRAFGYSLQGTQAERCFFLLYGNGRNGKSLCLRVFEMILGVKGRGYAQQVATSTFARSALSEINSGVAKLRGIRLATVGEFPNRNMNAELIKAMSGGESNTSRQLYSKTAEFPFQCKLWFTSNFHPGSSEGVDDAFWDRMKAIPCKEQFPAPGEVGYVPESVLMDRFRGEASGILNWLLEGYRMWRESGLMVPNSLKRAQEDYKAELDILRQFLEEEGIEVHPLAKSCPDDVYWTTLTSLWEIFDAWATRNGEDKRHRNQCRSRMEFRHSLEHHGYKVGGLYSPGSKHREQLKVYGIKADDISVLA